MPKSICYNGKCEIVETGFQIEIYYVCRTCKYEVDKELKEKIDLYREEQHKREQNLKNKEKEDAPSLFEFLDFPWNYD